MTHLKIGGTAPDFTWRTVRGQPIDLQAFRGHSVLLVFFRYSGCRYCTLQLWSLNQHYAKWHAMGLEVIAFFESPIEDAHTIVKRVPVPFAVCADPDLVIYRRYGVATSWWGAMIGILRRRADRQAIATMGLLDGITPSTGSRIRMPAQFLITPEGTIAQAHYGRDLGDFLPIDEISEFAGRYGTMPLQRR